MSSLRVPYFENSNFVAKIYFIFLKTPTRSNFKWFQYQIWTSVKSSSKTSISSKTNFITSLQISYSNIRLKLLNAKGFRVTKTVKQIKFEGTWGELEAKYCFQRQSWSKYIRQTLVLV